MFGRPIFLEIFAFNIVVYVRFNAEVNVCFENGSRHAFVVFDALPMFSWGRINYRLKYFWQSHVGKSVNSNARGINIIIA